ncbi:MAG: hypothetical protein ACREQ8_06860 [Woeseiaceae bacterium]
MRTEIAGVPCIGLNKVAMPGNLVALDVPARGRGYEILGEWPRREHQVTKGFRDARHVMAF